MEFAFCTDAFFMGTRVENNKKCIELFNKRSADQAHNGALAVVCAIDFRRSRSFYRLQHWGVIDKLRCHCTVDRKSPKYHYKLVSQIIFYLFFSFLFF